VVPGPPTQLESLPRLAAQFALLLDLVEHLVQWRSCVPLFVLVGARPELPISARRSRRPAASSPTW
jgi:hypothetical protein